MIKGVLVGLLISLIIISVIWMDAVLKEEGLASWRRGLYVCLAGAVIGLALLGLHQVMG